MAKVSLLLQNLLADCKHRNAIQQLLESPGMTTHILCLAFVTKSGVTQLRKELMSVASTCSAYVGIRNGVTSVQGIRSLFETGISVYYIDTGSASILYHPKIYAAFSDSVGHVLMGSANLTAGGLTNNIEASTKIQIDRHDQDDEKFFAQLLQTIIALPQRYPDHIKRIASEKCIAELLEEGRLEDEELTRATTIASGAHAVKRDLLKRFPVIDYSELPPPAVSSHPIIPKSTELMVPVWESANLTERDLSIPGGANTHATGSMGFKKGRLSEIDQRHYFRDVIFGALTWSPDTNPKKSHIERAEAEFNLQIKGVNFGVFKLRLSHNSKTDTKTYKQSNWMTQIHWGSAMHLVAHRDLLGRTLQLFVREKGTSFTIHID